MTGCFCNIFYCIECTGNILFHFYNSSDNPINYIELVRKSSLRTLEWYRWKFSACWDSISDSTTSQIAQLFTKMG